MQNYNYPQTPNVPLNNQPAFNINIFFRIAGGLAAIFFLFLPLGGLSDSGPQSGGMDFGGFSIKGWDLIKSIFEGKAVWNEYTILFLAALISGLVIIFLNRPLAYLITAAVGLIAFAIFGLKMKSQMGPYADMLVIKVGSYLGILMYLGIIVGSIFKMVTSKKNPVTQTYNAPPVSYPQQQQPYQQPMQQQYQAPPPPQPPIQQQYQAPPPQYQVPPQPQYQTPPPPQYQTPPPPQQMQQQAPKQKFCSKCGFKFPDNYTGKFCGKCGTQRIF